MSVFWDEGRAELETFCRDAREPSAGAPSPFNHFIKPDPDQLLRVSVGHGFKRGRLKYVYSILRGKDLETGEFSDDRRDQQFEVLKKSQAKTLNIQHWHDFFSAVREAGFRGGKMITSNNNLLFAYMLYLIGRTEFDVEKHDLRRVIARWFFMSALTGRYTGSPESAVESDLARLRGMTNAEEFVGVLDRECEARLTGDFWSITLPNDLATSSSYSPSLFAYYASLVLLDARALFSKQKVADLLDPSVHAHRAAAEKHHLFPKAYLESIGITDLRETNQIANYAVTEWKDNSDIRDRAPADYLPELRPRVSADELRQMYYWHALPDGWEHMDYHQFLERRRELTAKVIQDAYERLGNAPGAGPAYEGIDLDAVIRNGETTTVELKSTLRTNLHTGQIDPKMELACLRTIAGFLNSPMGGTLIIGVSDNGSPIGIGRDGFPNEDRMNLHLANLIRSRMGDQFAMYIHPHFQEYEDHRVLVVDCRPARSPVYVRDGDVERFYLRNVTSTAELSASQTQEYIKHRFG